jgi:hypothetical protein
MADMPMSPVALHGAKTCTEDSHNATGAAGWLGLAAAPVFAILALWTVLSGTEPGMLCMGMQGASPLNGMALMYALMSIFHAAPWMKLVSSRRIGALRSELRRSPA